MTPDLLPQDMRQARFISCFWSNQSSPVPCLYCTPLTPAPDPKHLGHLQVSHLPRLVGDLWDRTLPGTYRILFQEQFASHK